MHKCVNNTIGNVYHLEQWVDNFFPYSQKQLRFDQPVSIVFQSDEENASRMLGKTAYYDPESMQVVLYTDNRHPKDVMRSLSHELVHHAQNCRGDFKAESGLETGYAQNDPHLRQMEREAYTKGNLIFRDFEDLIKTGKINIEIDFSDSGEPKMSLKEWKNNEINTKLMKKWGFLKESKEVATEDLEERLDPSDPAYQSKKALLDKHAKETGKTTRSLYNKEPADVAKADDELAGEEAGEDAAEELEEGCGDAYRSEDEEELEEGNAADWAKIVGDTSPVPPHDLDVSDDERLRWEEDPATFAGFGTPGGGSDEDPHPIRALYRGDKKYDDEDVEYPKDVAAHEKRQRQAFAKQFKENKKISVREAKELSAVDWAKAFPEAWEELKKMGTGIVDLVKAARAEGPRTEPMSDEEKAEKKAQLGQAVDALKLEYRSGKISVREAKQITRRIIERIKKESK